MPTLLTGAAGFIGGHTAEELLKQDHIVIGIDNINDYYSPKIKEYRINLLKKYPNFIFIKGDILDQDLLESIFTNHTITAICHLAARAGVRPSIKDPKLYEEVNIQGTLNLLEAAKTHQISKFVFASSSSVYGGNKKIPFSEEDPVDHPVSPYAATKKSCELIAHAYTYLYDMTCIGLRYFTVYGPFGRPDMAPFLFTKAISEGTEITKFGDGSTKRDYTYIEDIVQGTIAALQKDHPSKYEIYNLGNNTPVSLNDFISTIERITGQKAIIREKPIFKGDVPLTYADIEKAKKHLDYNPSTSIEKGLAQLYDWLKEHKHFY